MMSTQKRVILAFVLLYTFLIPYGKCTSYENDDFYKSQLNEFEEEDDEPVVTKTVEDYKTFPIGEAFNLGTTDFYDTLVQGNKVIDKQASRECFRSSDATYGLASLETSTDLSSIYRTVSKEANLNTECTYYVTLKASLKAISSSMKWTKTEAKTSSVDYSSQVSVLAMEAGCIRKHFTKSFKAALKTLNADIKKPYLESSWRHYKEFVKRYGTHVMERVSFGARLQYFTATQSTASISDDMMSARACASVEGTTPGKSPFKVQGCAAYSKKQREESQSFHMQLKKFIRGGNKELRSQLLVAQTLDPKVIQDFINTADKSPQAIRYSFIPIWDLLPNDMYKQKANFFAYYTGFVQTGCTLLTGPTGFYIRHFRQDPQEPLNYQCVTRARGCHTDYDCSYSWGQVGCLCGGTSCIDYTKYGVPFVKLEGDSIHDEVSETCKYFAFKGCYCENNEKMGYVVKWPTAPKYLAN